MSYDTYYDGTFTIDPAMTSETVSLILARGMEIRNEYGEKVANPFGIIQIPLAPDDPGTELRVEEGRVSGINTDAIEDWLTVAVTTLVERGHAVTGEIYWEGDDRDDQGRLIVLDGKLVAQVRPDLWVDREEYAHG